MGVQSGWLPDTSFSASSQWDDRSAPFLGRLHNVEKRETRMVWTAGAFGRYQWWQVDLGMTMNITMVATQGGWDYTEWVKSYFVAYSQDGLEFHNVTGNNQTKVCGQRLGALPEVACTQSVQYISLYLGLQLGDYSVNRTKAESQANTRQIDTMIFRNILADISCSLVLAFTGQGLLFANGSCVSISIDTSALYCAFALNEYCWSSL